MNGAPTLGRQVRTSLLGHVLLVLTPTLRQPVQWVHLLLVVPLSSMVPFLLMITAFTTGRATDDLFYTNLAWGFSYFAVTQSFLQRDFALRTSRFDTLLVSPAPLWTWVVGSTIGVNLVFLASTGVGLLALTTTLGVRLELGRVALVLGLTFATNLVVSTFLFAIQIRTVRAFHTVNLSLDVVQALSGVLYPVSALPVLLSPLASALPTTWINELVRTREWGLIGPWTGTSALLLLLSTALASRAVRRHRSDGSTTRA